MGLLRTQLLHNVLAFHDARLQRLYRPKIVESGGELHKPAGAHSPRGPVSCMLLEHLQIQSLASYMSLFRYLFSNLAVISHPFQQPSVVFVRVHMQMQK